MASFLDYFRNRKTSSASVAKERLQIIVAHERNKRSQPDYLPELQRELVEVIKKYVQIAQDDVSIQVDDTDNVSVLELNITLPDR